MPLLSTPYSQQVLLADDDKDDCLLFRDALEELLLPVQLTTVHNGEQLMQLLTKNTGLLPDMLFLDLNMPRKNGLQCFAEIRQIERLKRLPIVIISTSFEQKIADHLYDQGAKYYIRKPNAFSKLKEVIYHALTATVLISHPGNGGDFDQPQKEEFVL